MFKNDACLSKLIEKLIKQFLKRVYILISIAFHIFNFCAANIDTKQYKPH